MLIWLKSRLAMIVVGIILIASLTGFMHIYKEKASDERLKNCCDIVSSQVNQMFTSTGDEVYQKIVFEDNNEGIVLPEKINDDRYILTIYRHAIMVKQGEKQKISRFNRDVHLWNPAERNHTSTLKDKEAKWRDKNHSKSFKLSSGDSNLMICMLRLDNGTFSKSHVFIFKVKN